MNQRSLATICQMAQAICHHHNTTITSLATIAHSMKEEEEEINILLSLLEDSVNNKVPRIFWTKDTSHGWWDFVVPRMTENDFIGHFRVSRSLFKVIMELVGYDISKEDTYFRPCIKVDKRVAIALKVLSTCCEYKNIAALFGVGVSTVHEIFRDFVNASNKIIVPKYIRWPTTTEEIRQKCRDFETMWNFPQVVAAIDGCHIPVSPPGDQTTDYYNYKGWHSVVALALCDATGKVMYVKTGCPGRAHDSAIFKGTKLYRRIVDNTIFPQSDRLINGVPIPYMILGDSAFELKPWLMKPFVHRGTLTDSQKNFNARLSRARRAVENLFARVKGRWRRIYKKMEMDINSVSSVINVAFAFHNLCEENQVFYDPQWSPEEEEGPDQPEQIQFDVIGQNFGTDVRAALQNYFENENSV